MPESTIKKIRVPKIPPPKPKKENLRATKVMCDSDVKEVYERCISGSERFKNYKPIFDYFETEQPLKSLHKKINANKSSIHDIINTLQKAGLIIVTTKTQYQPFKRDKFALQNKEVIEKLKQDLDNGK